MWEYVLGPKIMVLHPHESPEAPELVGFPIDFFEEGYLRIRKLVKF